MRVPTSCVCPPWSELGGAQKIVRSHLDATLGALSAEDQDIAADVFHHLVTPSGTKIAHAVADLVDYTNHAEDKVASVLDRLGEGGTRIVRFVEPPMGGQGPPRYEIFHDVLAPAVLDWRGRYAARRLEAQKEAAEQRARVQRHRALVAWGAALVAVALLAVFVDRQRRGAAGRQRLPGARRRCRRQPQRRPRAQRPPSPVGHGQEPHTASRGGTPPIPPQIEEERTLDFGTSVSATVFSPDGNSLAAGHG